MISSLQIQNFKCFYDLRLGLAPLTILAGYNAAGKSTTVQPFLLLAQALRRNIEPKVLPLNGDLVRLGSGAEVLAWNSRSRQIRLSFESGSDTITCIASVAEGVAANSLVVDHLLVSDETPHESEVPDSFAEMAHASRFKQLDSFKNLIYVSATRTGMSEVRPTPDDDAVFADVGASGQFAAAWYASNVDDEVQLSKRFEGEPGTTVRRQVDAYLGHLFPGASASADYIPRTGLVRLQFRTSDQSDWLRPANVGFGLSYAFPVLVACLLARGDQLLIIDSPEAHLHPRAQSRMGAFLAKIAAAGVQIIVETHSEHILNGARLAVHRKAVSPDTMAIHFFEGAREGFHGVQSPEIDRNGSLDYWPEGFFDQTEADLSVLSGLLS